MNFLRRISAQIPKLAAGVTRTRFRHVPRPGEAASLIFVKSFPRVPVYSAHLTYARFYLSYLFTLSKMTLFYCWTLATFVKGFYIALSITPKILYSVPQNKGFVYAMSLAETGTVVIFNIGTLTSRYVAVANIDQITTHGEVHCYENSDYCSLSETVTIKVSRLLTEKRWLNDVSLTLFKDGTVHAHDLLEAISKKREVDMDTRATRSTENTSYFEVK